MSSWEEVITAELYLRNWLLWAMTMACFRHRRMSVEQYVRPQL